MKYLYYGLAALFLVMALRNLLHGDLANAAAGLLIGALLLGAAVGVPREVRAIQEFQAWLVEHEAALRRGATLYYQDAPITATTELTRFSACFSIVLLTHSFTSRYLLRRSPRAARAPPASGPGTPCSRCCLAGGPFRSARSGPCRPCTTTCAAATCKPWVRYWRPGWPSWPKKRRKPPSTRLASRPPNGKGAGCGKLPGPRPAPRFGAD